MVTKQLDSRRQEIDTALTEIIDTIQKYFLVAPFQFIEGRDDDSKYFIFPDPDISGAHMFHSWAENWMAKLFPEAIEAKDKLNSEQIHSNAPGELAFASQRFGFVLGVLVGMKAMGATREELREKSRGFVIPAIGHAEYVQNTESKGR